MIRRRATKQGKEIFPIKIDELKKILQSHFEMNKDDLSFTTYEKQGKKIAVFFIATVVNSDKIDQSLLQPLLQMKESWTANSIANNIPIESSQKLNSFEHILEMITYGTVVVYVEDDPEAITYLLLEKEKRGLAEAETESLVVGPKIAFTESINTNMNIVRWRIRSTDLVMEELHIGKTVPREVRLVYMKSIANEADVNTMRQRLQDLDVGEIEDAFVLTQYIEDDQLNLFPQFDTTELPDRFTYAITKGKVGVLVENSPTGFTGPTTFFSLLESTEDLYMRWQAGTFLRLLRFIAVFFSIVVTPLYVAIITYQSNILPVELLVSIGQSRAAVPFPPLIEALFLELLIEFLREAGARLPTKVGQTMGIVGGIVIGQAAVEAGLTSNILIIVVAMSALASFTTPDYLMGTTIRIVRFPLILLSGFFGLVGLMFGLCFLVIHLVRLTSMGRPFLTPLYPLQISDFNKVFYRTPPNVDGKRAKSYRPKFMFRYGSKEAEEKHDVDE